MKTKEEILDFHSTVMDTNDDGTNGDRPEVLKAMQEYADVFAMEYFKWANRHVYWHDKHNCYFYNGSGTEIPEDQLLSDYKKAHVKP